MQLIDQHRTGVLPEHEGLEFRGAHLPCCRLTTPAREALEAAGAVITPAQQPASGVSGAWVPSGAPHWSVELMQSCPQGLVVSRAAGSSAIQIRRHDEPEWPGGEVAAEWEQVDLTPCPHCGSPLVWYEAAYSGGYRVCAGPEHHHWQAD